MPEGADGSWYHPGLFLRKREKGEKVEKKTQILILFLLLKKLEVLGKKQLSDIMCKVFIYIYIIILTKCKILRNLDFRTFF